MTTLQTAVFDTKPYDRESLQRAASNGEIARVTVANLVAFATGQPFLPGTTLNAQLESR